MKEIAFLTAREQVLVDTGIFMSALALAYVIRFDGTLTLGSAAQLLVCLPWIVGMRLLLTWKRGIYSFASEYFSLPDVVATGQAQVLPTVLLLGLRFFYPFQRYATWLRLPLSIIVLEFLLSFGGLVLVRVFLRTKREAARNGKSNDNPKRKRVLLYGAGSAGTSFWKQLHHEHDVEVVGFIDDDPGKIGRSIAGLKVCGNGEALGQLVSQYQVQEVIITIANCNRALLTRILSKCTGLKTPAKVVPSVGEVMRGSATLTQVRDVGIELVLGRDGVRLQDVNKQVRDTYSGKRILVTGAGGSIGSELVRQLLLCQPRSLGLFDKDENSIYELEQELRMTHPDGLVESHVGDIRLRDRLLPTLMTFCPEIVFHAAAHKHVPLMEKHPCEAILNNVYGTQTLLEACCQAGVKRFVFISTDKAVNPSSIMGATKRLGELLVHYYASTPMPRPYTCVRFGNVIGSRGSIIPLFQKQIAGGGPITVTHPDMVRYFMSIPEAAQLVLHAGTLGKGGEVFVLEMGSPRRILDVACEMARLSGLEPRRDIEIAITGLRPGEKLIEELVGSTEHLSPTGVDKLLMVQPGVAWNGHILNDVAKLVAYAQVNDADSVYRLLGSMSIGFRPKCKVCLSEYAMDGRLCEFCSGKHAWKPVQLEREVAGHKQITSLAS
jgi:FlaA1/EpsC-like NDP-sugar epimerase